ncbi:MAG: RNase adapter RapZ [Desulfitobacterium sp.]|nr:RNase adapter RapZ [Desulfitobacterium sp.]
MTSQKVRMLIITGLSGAGKSQALQSLEDLGYFCVDNLPPSLILKFAELCMQSQGNVKQAAIVCDLRGGEFFSSLAEALDELKEEGFHPEILFLEASDEVLVGRYKESRRRHPLSPSGGILEGIQMERQKLTELRGVAHKIIDTSGLTASQLKQQVAELFGSEYHVGTARLAVSLVSFGFKYAIPLDVDLLIDVRFLPNPFYVSELRPLTGEDPQVQEYIFSNPIAQEFLERYINLLEFILPYYVKEGKRHLVIGVGCTGGQHRSVAIVEKLAIFLQDNNYNVSIKHRDAARSRKGDRAK